MEPKKLYNLTKFRYYKYCLTRMLRNCQNLRSLTKNWDWFMWTWKAASLDIRMPTELQRWARSSNSSLTWTVQTHYQASWTQKTSAQYGTTNNFQRRCSFAKINKHKYRLGTSNSRRTQTYAKFTWTTRRRTRCSGTGSCSMRWSR